MTDEELVQGHLHGNADAFNALAERYQDRLYRLAYRMLGHHDDAQDAVQEILLRLLKSLPRYRGQSRFGTWLFRLAANTCIDLRRRQGPAPTLPLDPDTPIAAPHQDPDTLCERGFQAYLLNQALMQLPAAQRTLLVLRDQDELPNQDVAAVLGIDVGTLKSRLHRARQTLRRTLESGVTVAGLEQYGRIRVTATGDLA